MKKKTMLEYISSIDRLSKESFLKMVSLYGENNVCNFLNGIVDDITNSDLLNKKDKKVLLDKFGYFINCDNECDEEVENNCDVDNYFHKPDFEKTILVGMDSYDNINLVKLYLSDIGKYPLLTLEEEQKYGKDLKLFDNINIFVKKMIGKQIEPVIDLEKVFVSINSNDSKEKVIGSLIDYYSKYAKEESKADKIVLEYLCEYDKLCLKLERIPDVYDLNSYFSNYGIYKLFDEFRDSSRLGSDEIINQVSNYIKYMVARNTMINSNLRLVVSVAKRYYGIIDFLDLVAFGNVGLINAVENFDVDKGCKFSSYAVVVIRNEIVRSIDSVISPIRKPEYLYANLNKFKNRVKLLEEKYGRKFTNNELAEILGENVEDINNYDVYFENVCYLDKSFGDGENKYCLLDMVSSGDDVYASVEKKCIREQIDLVLATLSEKERDVLTLLFGLDSDINVGKTLEEVGKKFGVTREAIRQTKEKGIQKLRRPSCRRKLESFI